jgi:uncharacterized repeat protein (TIGR01451 family)
MSFMLSGRIRTAVASVAALVGLTGTLLVAAPAVAVEYDPVEVYLSKDASTDIVQPGQNFTYSFQVGCTSLTDACVDLVITDTIPAPFELVAVADTSTGDNAASATIASDGNDITVTFTDDLQNDDGSVGMLPSNYFSFVATVTLPEDVSAEYDGQTVRNTAYVSVANPNTGHTQAHDDVTLEIPLTLASTVTKAYSPSTMSAIEGSPVTMTLGATNSSNSPVDSLTIEDPSNQPSNAFDYVAVTDADITTWPSGADRVQTDWFDGTDWQAGTPQVDVVLPAILADIRGLRFTFTSTTGQVARGATAGITVAGELRANVTEIVGSATVTNVATSYVTLGEDEQLARPTATKTLTLSEVTVNPVATKTITPSSVIGGETVTVDLHARNGGEFTLSAMTITEPATGTDSFADQGLEFVGWVADDIEWPVGATGATVAYQYDGDTDFGTPIVATAGTLPDPEVGRTVVAFRVVFTGTMLPEQYASVPFTALTLTVLTDVASDNTMALDVVTTGGMSASTTATDDLTRRTARVNTLVDKVASPTTIYSVAGASSVISLPARVAPRPTGDDEGGSTVGATRLVVSDTADPATDPFWEYFDLAAIVATSVPSGVTMAVEYWDGDSWEPFDGPIAGPTSYSRTLTSGERAAVGGIRFVFTSTADGTLLQPGASFQPNIRVSLRDELRSQPGVPAADPAAEDTVTVENTVLSEVFSDTAPIGRAEARDELTYSLLPVPGSGGGGGGGTIPLIDKEWDNTEDAGVPYVNARSGDQATLRLNWGTGGLEFESMVISDPVDPTGAVSGTVFEAFDLVRIPAITPSMDPLLTYDRITGVELYYEGAWHATSACSGSACDGTFPGYTLTTTEREKATGVRFIIEESPTRAARIGTNPAAPPVGSGVADTMNRTRQIALVFEVRDVRRSDDTVPVLGSTRGSIYNAGSESPGQVVNSALAVGTPVTGETRSSQDSDTILILDTPIAVEATKSWTGGPLGTPPAGTPAELYPTARMTVTAENTSEAVRVDRLLLVEPSASTSPNPFDYVNITDIVDIQAPDDAAVVVTVQPSGTEYTVAEAEALTRAQLADVTGVSIVATGRVAPGATIRLVADTQLRETQRGTATAIRDLTLPMTLDNEVNAAVADLGGTDTNVPIGNEFVVHAYATASVDIEYLTFGVTGTKSITADTVSTGSTPAIQYADNTTATVRITGQPSGNVRTTRMVMEDSDASFWNAFDFSGFSSFTFASPINRVQVDALVGVDYTLGGPDGIAAECPEPDGDCWVIGTPGTSLTLPAGVNPEDVRGLRFTFTKSDYSAWERPFNPLQTVRFTVERREYLVEPTDQLVPTTSFTFTEPAPGETEIGTLTDTITVDAAAAVDADDTSPLWTAHAEDTAAVTVTHLPALVSVTKSEYGPRSLGVDIPFEITVTNLGNDRGAGDHDATLTGLTVVENLPVVTSGSNTGKPMLVIPDNPDTGLPYDPSVAFTYSLVAPGGAETTVTNVTATLNTPTDPTQVTFEYAGDLELGWALVVHATMRFRPLLQAGTLATNTVDVTADQPFDLCRETTNGTTVTELTNVLSCGAQTTVYPLPSSPLSITKSVRGVDAGPLDENGEPTADDLGVLRTTGTANCPTNTLAVPGSAETFYRYPCVPITRPGSIEEWGTRLYNGGNIDVKKIVAIDVLPRINDLGVIINGSRDSKWTATLTNYPQVTDLPAGWDYTVYYTDEVGVAVPRCNATDIQTTMGVPADDPTIANPACLDPGDVDYVGDRPWQVLATDAGAEVLASVVAMKLVIFATESAPLGLEPGQAVGLLYQTRTADYVEIPEATDRLYRDSVAYNSLAAAAVGTLDDNDLPYRFVVEPRKVGVALATGEIEIRKDVTGDAASYATGTFDLAVACTTPDGDPIPLTYADGSARSPYTVSEGSTLLVQGIPLYAVCSVDEARDYGQSNTPGPITVVAQAAQAASASTVFDEKPAFAERVDTELATLTNEYPAADLVISKTIEVNGAVDQDGTPIAYLAALVSATCTFDNGTGATTVWSVTNQPVTPSSPLSKTGLPAGTTCTVTETNARGATTTSTVTTDAGAVSGGASPAAFTLTEGDNSVAFANDFGVGSLTVTKALAGLAKDEDWAAGPFDIRVVCTNANANPTTVWAQTFELSRASTTRTIDHLPAGSSCTITEPESNGANSVALPSAVTITRDTTASATVTNTFDYARLTVSKTVTTNAVDGSGTATRPGPFSFSVVCTFTHDGVTDTVIGDEFSASPMTFSLSHGGSQAITGLPTGSSCTVTESTPVGSPTTSMRKTTSSASPTSTNGLSTTIGPLTKDTNPTTGTNTVQVTNTYPVGSLKITKSLQGGASTQFGTGPFTFHIECTQPGIAATYTKNVTITGGAGSQTVANILAGSVCSVTETSTGTGEDARVYLDNSNQVFDGTGVTIVGSATRTVTVQNWYLTGQVTVSKTVTGPGAAFATGPFTVSLACTRDGKTVTIAGGAIRSLTTSTPVTYTLLPNGASCTLTETGTYGAGTVSMSDGTTTTGNGFTFVVDANESSLTDNQTQPALTVTNRFELAELVVSKDVVSDAENEDGDLLTYGDFGMQVTCTFQGTAVKATGFASTTMTFTLADGASRTLTGLPAGAICQVTETDAQGAARTSIVTTAGSADPVATNAATASITLASDVDGASNSAAITNTFDSGSIVLSKVVTGAARTQYGTGTFTVTVECTLAASEQTVWTGTYTFTDGSDPVTLSPLATGASCAIAETDAAGATSTTITVGSTTTSGPTATAVVPASTSRAVVVTNQFDYASLVVGKTVTSDAVDENGDPVYPGGEFAIQVVCTFLGETVLAAEYTESPMTFTLDHDEETTLTGIPAGADCVVTETDWVSADSTTIAVATADDTDSIDGRTATVTALTSDDDGAPTNSAQVTNRYGVGSITVEKILDGGGMPETFGTGPFDLHVVCVAPGDVTAYDGTVSLPDDGAWEATIEDIPVDSVCTVEESNVAETGADAHRIVDRDGEDATSTVVSLETPGYLAVVNYYLSGSVEVSKEVTGLGSAFGTGPFEVTLECTRSGTTVTLPGGNTRTLADGGTVTFTGLPSGASCTLSESDPAGATSSSIEVGGSTVATDATDGYTFTVNVTGGGLENDQPQPAIHVVNDFPHAGLSITKAVETAAVDEDGTPIAYGPFEVTVTCTFEGETVYASGYDSEDPMVAELADGGDAWVLRDLPAGAECTIDETDPADADATTYVVTQGGATDETAGTSATVVLTPDVGDAVTTVAAITNHFDTGSLTIAKAVTGDGAEAWGTETFTIDVVCTLTDGSGTREVYAGTFDVEQGDDPITIDNLATRAVCDIEETATGAATATTITVGSDDATPGTTAQATIPADELDVTVTNRFDVTSIDVTKEITGAGAEDWGQNSFRVSLVCTRDVDGATQSIAVPDGATRDLVAPDYTAEYAGLPVGADCALAEILTGGANGSAISPNAFTLEGEATAVTVSNEFTVGSLRVVKAIEGDGVGTNEDWGSGPFEVELVCTREIDGETVTVAVPGGATRTLTRTSVEDPYSATYEGLPTGASCSVEETVTGEATATVVSPESAVVGADDTVDITVTNTFTIGQLEIVKTATSPVVQALDVFDYTLDVTNVGTVPAAGLTVIDEFPSTLRVTEVASDGWDECTLSGGDELGFGRTLECHDADTLLPGDTAPRITVTVEVVDGIAQDAIDNTATVTSSTRGVAGDDDDERVLVKWLNVTAASECVLDAPWFTYDIDARNVDTAGKTLTVTWRDGSGTIIKVDEVPLTGGNATGKLLWPGAAVDENGVGVAWPGWRAARAGETPDWENLVLDPTLPDYGLRDDTEVELSINPSTSVTLTYPPQTPDCAVVRTPDIWITKTASTPIVAPGGAFEYTIATGNDGLGALRDYRLVDEVPAQLIVTAVTPADPADDTQPAWEECTVTDRLANGAGGTVECLLDRPLGWGQTVPDVVVAVRLVPGAGAGTVVNTAVIHGTSADDDTTIMTAEDAALVASMLPNTGGGLAGFLIPFALGFIVLGGVVVIVRARPRVRGRHEG